MNRLRWLLLIACIARCLPASAHAQVQPMLAVATMPIKTYMDTYATWYVLHEYKSHPSNPSSGLVFRHHFPELIIYDPSGSLVYFGIDIQQNLQALKQFPHFAKSTSVPAEQISMDGMLSLAPPIASTSEKIKRSHCYLIYSIVASKTINQRSVPQADAIYDLSRHMRELKVNIVQITLVQ